MKRANVVLLVLGLFLVAGCGQAPPDEPANTTDVVTEEPEPVTEARHDMVYICACGPECDCGAVAVTPGNCDCGTALAAAHLLKVEGNEGVLCTCGGDCSCELDADDPSKCSCGKDVTRVSFEGQGLYYCNCGGSCTCNFITAAPGTCHCGMDLVTS